MNAANDKQIRELQTNEHFDRILSANEKTILIDPQL